MLVDQLLDALAADVGLFSYECGQFLVTRIFYTVDKNSQNHNALANTEKKKLSPTTDFPNSKKRAN